MYKEYSDNGVIILRLGFTRGFLAIGVYRIAYERAYDDHSSLSSGAEGRLSLVIR